MSAEVLISRLEGVKRTGPSRWIARCSAHTDRRPSLAIRELDDGRVLAHCFAGCEVGDVLAAVGLDFDALYPDRTIENGAKRERRPFSASDVLSCVGLEVLVVAVAASLVSKGESLAEGDRERLLLAATRLQSAVELAHGT